MSSHQVGIIYSYRNTIFIFSHSHIFCGDHSFTMWWATLVYWTPVLPCSQKGRSQILIE